MQLLFWKLLKTLLMLNVVLNCIAFWNTLAIQQIVSQRRAEGDSIDESELRHLTPTMTHPIDWISKFEINLSRRTPFTFSRREVKEPDE
ncbi:Tn3 family transposase [Candidatus Poribacteria bacterium]|nr:Tn3 family transposase [Candidatus Poribacteria bacterium]